MKKGGSFQKERFFLIVDGKFDPQCVRHHLYAIKGNSYLFIASQQQKCGSSDTSQKLMYRYCKQLKKQCPSWPTGREVMTTSSCWVRGYNSTPSPTVQSTPVNRTVERDSAVSGY